VCRDGAAQFQESRFDVWGTRREDIDGRRTLRMAGAVVFSTDARCARLISPTNELVEILADL